MGLILFSLVGVSPAFCEKLSSYIQMPIIKYKLDNGMRVILNPNKNSSVVRYLFGIPIGSRHERKGNTGISHMFEHLMFKGTQKYPHFFKTHGKHGIVHTNAFTSFDYTGYTAVAPPEKLELILDMEADRFVNLTFTQEELDQERKAVQEERKRSYENTPSGHAWIKMLEVVFKKHPYKHPIIGYKDDIANYNLKQIREWYKTYYSPNNAVLVLSGHFEEDHARSLIEKYFKDLKPQKIPKEEVVKEPPQKKTQSATLKLKVQNASMRIVFKVGPSNTKDYAALRMIAALLGGGESSRLYKSFVRDKKIASWAFSNTMGLAQESGFFIRYNFLDKEAKQHQLALKLVQKELNRLSTEPVSLRELEKAKNMYLNLYIEELEGSEDSLDKIHNLFTWETAYGDYREMYRSLDLLNEITPDYVQKVAQKYLQPHLMSYVLLRSE